MVVQLLCMPCETTFMFAQIAILLCETLQTCIACSKHAYASAAMGKDSYRVGGTRGASSRGFGGTGTGRRKVGAGGGMKSSPGAQKKKKRLPPASRNCLACTKGKHCAHTCGVRGKEADAARAAAAAAAASSLRSRRLLRPMKSPKLDEAPPTDRGVVLPATEDMMAESNQRGFVARTASHARRAPSASA
mgnify:CR=1 FL=1